MMVRALRRAVLAAACAMAVVPVAARAGATDAADATTVTAAHPTVSWSGTVVGAGDQCAASVACAEVPLTVRLPAGYWRHAPGGVTFRIQWRDVNQELDLVLYDPRGAELGAELTGGETVKNIFVAAPVNGVYRVEVQGTDAADTAYLGSARIVHFHVPSAHLTVGTMRFAQTLVDPQRLAAEPGVTVDRQGRVYVAAPYGADRLTSFLWRSTDGARTFRLVGDAAGPVHDPRHRACTDAVDSGGDISTAVDRTGRLYVADVGSATIAAGYSLDHGDHWVCGVVPGSLGVPDRPWLAAAPTADGVGLAVDAYLSFVDFTGQLPGVAQKLPVRVHLLVTRDGGRSWVPAGTFGAGLDPTPGPMFVAPDRTVYQVFSSEESVWLARSRDEGSSFSVQLVARRYGNPRGDGWVAGAVDAAGTVYVAWVDPGTFDVVYVYSNDHGRSWSRPLRLSPPGQTTMKVWLAAAGRGDVAVGWYAATDGQPLYPGAPPGTPWNVWAARSLHADGPEPSFVVARVSDRPVFRGPAAVVGQPSALGDFFQVAIAPTGQLIVAFSDAGRRETPSTLDVYKSPRPYVVVARQLDGTGMSAASERSAAEPWSARPPVLTPQTCLVRAPRVHRVGGLLQVDISVADGRNLSAALDGTTAATAVWLVVWRNQDREQYVGAQVDRSGRLSYFAGNRPTPVVYPSPLGPTEAADSYPAVLPATGTALPSAATLRVEVPMRLLGLSDGDVLHDVQGFSFLVDTQPLTALWLWDEVSSSAAATQTLG